MSQPDSTPVPRTSDERRRYPGARPFDEQDRTRFFGRTRATEELLLRVLSVRLLLQFAPSGVGKTSLLTAGLFPRLRHHNLFPFIVRLNDEKETLTQATRRSLKAAAGTRGLNKPVIPEAADNLWDLLAGVQLWSQDLLLLAPVLVFDQFEEVFTLRDEAFRQDFAKQVGALSMQRQAEAEAARRLGPPRTFRLQISGSSSAFKSIWESSRSSARAFRSCSTSGCGCSRSPPTKPGRPSSNRQSSKARGGSPRLLPSQMRVSTCFVELHRRSSRHHSHRAVDVTAGVSAGRGDCDRPERRRRPAHVEGERFRRTRRSEQLVQHFFTNELKKLDSSRTARRARDMFEQGLLDPTGKRLMLEEGEIERRFGVRADTLRTLVDCRLLRREPRNESIFYEITHDRLTEAIARNRRVILPRWFWPGVAASIVFVILASFTALWMYKAREEAKRALNVLLGEPLVGRLREVGLSDALERVLDDADVDSSSNSLASALSLRHEGDILWEHADDQGSAGEVQRIACRLGWPASRLGRWGSRTGRQTGPNPQTPRPGQRGRWARLRGGAPLPRVG